jgi:phage terminase large subunit-like protein
MKTDPDYPYTWDEEKAAEIVKWFSMLRHRTGVLAKQPINLTPWQKFRHCQLYGWRRKSDGRKRFTKSFTEVARKNGKSQEEAGIALFEISVESNRHGEIYEYYTAGVKKDQSRKVFDEARYMLNGSPLKRKFRVTRNEISYTKNGSFIRMLSKDDSKNGDGSNPAGLILDEYHEHPNTDYYDLSMGMNAQEPLLMIITTAGKNLTYPAYTQEYKLCAKILNPHVQTDDDTYLVDICELDPEDYENLDNLDNEDLWKKANPIRMSYPEGRDRIRQAYKIAKEVPEKMTGFLTKMMDVWVQAKEASYMDMAKWEACEVESIPYDLKGRPVYVGFDMSSKIDLTSVAFVTPIDTEKTDAQGEQVVTYVVFSHSFIPTREKLVERTRIDHFNYDAAERGGFLTVTDTPIVNQSAVMRYVIDTCDENEWKIQTLCFDPANASKIMMDLSDEGYEVEEVFQSHKSLNESTQGFREQVYSKNIMYTKNPLLNFAMSNAVIRRSNGLIKIDKDSTIQRIDPVDAVLCAYKLAMYHEFSDDQAAYLDKFIEDLQNGNF